jgi:hypothetical protein
MFVGTRETTGKAIRVVLDVSEEPTSRISSKPDPRVITLVRLIACQAAREFVRGAWDDQRRDRPKLKKRSDKSGALCP